jgi:ferritin-like metal-binding protein YciE
MKLDSLMDLYITELKDMYNAEKQLIKALPKMAKGANTPELAEAFQSHLDETKGQAQRLERIFKDLGKPASGETCEAMKGLITEGEEILSAKGDDGVRDAGIIVAAQKVEHYEIAGYGCLCAHARLLGREDDVALLEESLEQEKAADKTLNDLAEDVVNSHASEQHPVR